MYPNRCWQLSLHLGLILARYFYQRIHITSIKAIKTRSSFDYSLYTLRSNRRGYQIINIRLTQPWHMLSHLCDPQIYLWCDTCLPYGGQHGSRAFLIHILADVSMSIGGDPRLKPKTVHATSTVLYTIRPLRLKYYHLLFFLSFFFFPYFFLLPIFSFSVFCSFFFIFHSFSTVFFFLFFLCLCHSWWTI